ERSGIPRVTQLGECALLLDAAEGAYKDASQARIWALAQSLHRERQTWRLSEIVPGMNNLMVVFEAETPHCAQRLKHHLQSTWLALPPHELPGRVFEIDVEYDARPG